MYVVAAGAADGEAQLGDGVQTGVHELLSAEKREQHTHLLTHQPRVLVARTVFQVRLQHPRHVLPEMTAAVPLVVLVGWLVLSFNNIHYSQTRIKETHWAVRKGFLLSIVSFISCPINVEGLTCIKSEEWKRFLYPNVSFIRVRLYIPSHPTLEEGDIFSFVARDVKILNVYEGQVPQQNPNQTDTFSEIVFLDRILGRCLPMPQHTY